MAVSKRLLCLSFVREIYDSEVDPSVDIEQERLEFIIDMINIIQGNKTTEMKDQLIRDHLIIYENKFFDNMKNNQSWDFWNSFIFAGTIFTTIGYGHICPKTTAGRAVSIMYAVIGIPLFLIALTVFAKFVSRNINFHWAYISRSINRSNCKKAALQQEVITYTNIEETNRPSHEIVSEDTSPQTERQNETNPDVIQTTTESDEEFHVPISVALFILLCYMLCGAAVAQLMEEWTFFESFYCIFISMSTIGLGDFVGNSKFVFYSTVYIMVGLSLTAMCIDVIQRNLVIMFRDASHKFKEMELKIEEFLSHDLKKEIIQNGDNEIKNVN